MKSIEGSPEKFRENSLEDRLESIEYPRVTLHFLRHSIKEKSPEEIEDKDVHISNEGRDIAAQKFDDEMNLRFGHIVGSPRIRTLETAAVVATMDSEVNPEDLGVGKARINEALDFVADDTEYGKKFVEAYKNGRTLSFLVHESDALAEETGDINSSTFSRMAANVARIIIKNYDVAVRGAAILDQSVNPANKKNDFERILATHATVQESFLLKLVERVRGIQERETLLSLIGENGFDYVEGFDVVLSKEGSEEKIRIKFQKGDFILDEIVPIEVLKELV